MFFFWLSFFEIRGKKSSLFGVQKRMNLLLKCCWSKLHVLFISFQSSFSPPPLKFSTKSSPKKKKKLSFNHFPSCRYSMFSLYFLISFFFSKTETPLFLFFFWKSWEFFWFLHSYGECVLNLLLGFFFFNEREISLIFTSMVPHFAWVTDWNNR